MIQIVRIMKVVLTKYAKIPAITHLIPVEIKPYVHQLLIGLCAPVKMDLLAMLLRSATNVFSICLIDHKYRHVIFHFLLFSWMQDQ